MKFVLELVPFSLRHARFGLSRLPVNHTAEISKARPSGDHAFTWTSSAFITLSPTL